MAPVQRPGSLSRVSSFDCLPVSQEEITPTYFPRTPKTAPYKWGEVEFSDSDGVSELSELLSVDKDSVVSSSNWADCAADIDAESATDCMTESTIASRRSSGYEAFHQEVTTRHFVRTPADASVSYSHQLLVESSFSETYISKVPHYPAPQSTRQHVPAHEEAAQAAWNLTDLPVLSAPLPRIENAQRTLTVVMPHAHSSEFWEAFAAYFASRPLPEPEHGRRWASSFLKTSEYKILSQAPGIAAEADRLMRSPDFEQQRYSTDILQALFTLLFWAPLSAPSVAMPASSSSVITPPQAPRSATPPTPGAKCSITAGRVPASASEDEIKARIAELGVGLTATHVEKRGTASTVIAWIDIAGCSSEREALRRIQEHRVLQDHPLMMEGRAFELRPRDGRIQSGDGRSMSQYTNCHGHRIWELCQQFDVEQVSQSAGVRILYAFVAGGYLRLDLDAPIETSQQGPCADHHTKLVDCTNRNCNFHSHVVRSARAIPEHPTEFIIICGPAFTPLCWELLCTGKCSRAAKHSTQSAMMPQRPSYVDCNYCHDEIPRNIPTLCLPRSEASARRRMFSDSNESKRGQKWNQGQQQGRRYSRNDEFSQSSFPPHAQTHRTRYN